MHACIIKAVRRQLMTTALVQLILGNVGAIFLFIFRHSADLNYI